MESFTSQLEQLRSEFAAEQEGRRSDTSEAEAAAEELKATIKQLQETVSSETEARSIQEQDASSKILELSDPSLQSSVFLFWPHRPGLSFHFLLIQRPYE